jgi:hypothetical protein
MAIVEDRLRPLWPRFAVSSSAPLGVLVPLFAEVPFNIPVEIEGEVELQPK